MYAEPSRSRARLARPSGCPSSIRTGRKNDSPALVVRAASRRGEFSAWFSQTAMTRASRAASTGGSAGVLPLAQDSGLSARGSEAMCPRWRCVWRSRMRPSFSGRKTERALPSWKRTRGEAAFSNDPSADGAKGCGGDQRACVVSQVAARRWSWLLVSGSSQVSVSPWGPDVNAGAEAPIEAGEGMSCWEIVRAGESARSTDP
jgi:hypothetical protein